MIVAIASAPLRRLLPASGPLQRMAGGTLISAVGNGAWFTCWALFFTRSVGLPAAQVGAGMTIGAALGVVCAPWQGWLGDRIGPRELFAAQLTAQAVLGTAFAIVHDFTGFVLVAGLTQIASSGTGGPRNALLLGLADEADKFQALSLQRAISHVGWALGAILGGVIITINTRSGYLALLAVNAGSYAIYAGLVLSVPHVTRPRQRSSRPRRRVLADLPYMSLAGMTGILALCWAMLSSGLPLWVALHTHAPQAISAVVVILSSLGIAAFQVRVSRGITAPARAARGAVISGMSLAVACILLALTNGQSGVVATTLILIAAAFHITGELFFVASSWGLSVPLMAPDAPSEYQGAFSTGESLALMIAPALITLLVADWGQPGWLFLAAIFLIPAAAIPPATRWAQRTRPVSP